MLFDVTLIALLPANVRLLAAAEAPPVGKKLTPPPLADPRVASIQIVCPCAPTTLIACAALFDVIPVGN